MLSERIKGQDHALTKAIQVLARAAAGLSGGAGAADSKPRGILFLAGPTGTGKTELAKTLTQIVFSDERRMIRFDMSEFAAAHADQRLFGAPPGYVGYESGGELTNAVREHPFSILLFDEIEKAHPDILDKFLQILEDGRLTDSHGDTVYFGGTFIIFTSNLGMSSRDEKTGEILADIRPGQLSYEQLRQQVWQGIRANMRPELLNRIGENYIVFDFISEQTAREILQVKLIAVQKKMQEDRGISLRFGSELVARLEELACANIANGGRGVVNIVEEYVLNPLAMTLFACDIGAGERLELLGHYAGTDKKLAGTFEYRRV
jgi:ATP-dependent Clp protease ATP-binding subunit ClpA